MKLARIIIAILILFASSSQFLLSGHKVYAKTNSLQFKQDITDWVIDDTNGFIYAITSDEVLFIRQSDLKIEQKIPTENNPSDIDLFQGKLYVALSNTKNVIILDSSNGKILNTYELAFNPYKIEVDQNRIYYVGNESWQSIWMYEFETNQSTKISKPAYNTNGSYAGPDLLLDSQKQILYIGESDMSSGRLYIMKTTDFSQVSFSEEVYSPYRKVIKDGRDLYYTNRRFDDSNRPGYTVKKYGQRIIYAKYPHVFGTNTIYNRIGESIDLPFQIDQALTNNLGNIFLFRNENKTLYKYDSVDDIKKLLPLDDVNALKYYPKDIENHWAKDQLFHLVHSDIINGYEDLNGDVTLNPDNPITRAEFITLLVRALQLKSATPGINFNDVQHNDWFYEPIQIASSLGIVSGINDKQFAPEQFIKRDEISAIIVRAFGNSLRFEGTMKQFVDVGVYWATPFIDKASRAGIINGYANGTFKPIALATRAEAATILFNGLRKEQANLSSDSKLIDVVRKHSRALQEPSTNKNYDTWYNALHDDTTGANRELGYQYIRTLLVVYERNGIPFTIDYDSKGESIEKVIEKSDRLAVVESKYGEKTITSFLKKDNGAWKLYGTKDGFTFGYTAVKENSDLIKKYLNKTW